MNSSFNWTKDGLCINICGRWLDAEETKKYLKAKRCCFNCRHGDFIGSHFVCGETKAQDFVGIAGCCYKYERL